MNSGAMLKIGIKYCGGCNPYYNRVALVGRIKTRLQGKVEFVSPDKDSVDLVLAVEFVHERYQYSRKDVKPPVRI